MRKFTVVMMIVLFLALIFTGLAQATPQIILDGQALAFDVPPTIENDRTLVPLRAIFEALGAGVNWDGVTQTVTATKGTTEIRLAIGGAAYKNGQPVNLDVPAKIISDRTMVPLRFVSEALGCQVSWDGATQTVTITSASGTIKVHFIDVGQADAIYISLPDQQDVLIDGGNEADGSTVVNYLNSQGVDDIELLIATHPHEDHIGGLPAILDTFQVERIIDSGKGATSNIYNEYAGKAAEGAEWIPDNSQTYTFGDSELQILTGPGEWDNLNDYSVVCRLDTGDIEFLFMGDASGPAETALTGELDSEFLKVGHHGSRTSSSSSFLARVTPEVAIISVGASNSYGHPTAEALQRLQDAGATVYRTDLYGTIIVSTDGHSYSVETGYTGPAAAPEPVIQDQTQVAPQPAPAVTTEGKYVGSIKSDKYHYPSCRYAQQIAPGNLRWFHDAAEAQAAGYVPCGVCKP